MGGRSSKDSGVCIVSAHELQSGGDTKSLHRIKTTTSKASCDNYKSWMDKQYGSRPGVFTQQYFRKKG